VRAREGAPRGFHQEAKHNGIEKNPLQNSWLWGGFGVASCGFARKTGLRFVFLRFLFRGASAAVCSSEVVRILLHKTMLVCQDGDE
jgi:hypothetical protein